MKRFFLALAFATALATSATAQNTISAQPGVMLAPAPGPAVGAGQVGAPTYVVPPVEDGGVINIGQALGPFLAPYFNALVNALILGFVSWLGVVLKNKFDISIDEGSRNALVTALQNQAGSLIADGLVKIEQNGKITVPSQNLVESANEIMGVIPDAATRLGFTPDYLVKRIVDTIPQTAAGAAMIAAAAPASAAPKPAVA